MGVSGWAGLIGEGLSQVAMTLASGLVASVWQGLVLVALAAVALWSMPGLGARTRSAVWGAVLLVVLAAGLLPLLGWSFGGNAATVSGAQGALRMDPRWGVLLLAVWFVCSAVRLLRLAAGVWQVRSLARRAHPVDLSRQLAGVLPELRRPVEVCVSDEVTRPCVAGYRRPRVLLPSGLLRDLSEGELRQVLLHELEHVRRRDDWSNLLQKLALAIFPLNPAMLIAERRMCVERELACDDRVLRASTARKGYAACLARMASRGTYGRGAALVLGAWGRRPELLRRVERILRPGEREMSAGRARVLAGMVTAGLVLGAAGLVREPALVQFGAAPEIAAAAPVSAAWQYVPARALMPAVSSAHRHWSDGRLVPLKAVTGAAPVRPARLRVRARVPRLLPRVVRTAYGGEGYGAPGPLELRAEPVAAPAQPQVVPVVWYAIPTDRGWVLLRL